MLGKWNGKTMLLKQKFIVLCCIYVEKSKLDMCRVSNSHTSCLLTNCLQLLPVACAVFKPLVQFNSVTQLCPTLSDTMDCSMPGLPVHHQLLELTHIHIHWVSDAMQPSHPLLSPSPPAFNLSQHQGLFQWVGSSHQVAKVLEFQLQHQSFQWIFRTDFL